MDWIRWIEIRESTPLYTVVNTDIILTSDTNVKVILKFTVNVLHKVDGIVEPSFFFFPICSHWI